MICESLVLLASAFLTMVKRKSCHKCAGSLEKAHPSIQAHCPVCGTGYHTSDCGMRYLAKGLHPEDVFKCPKCYNMCECSGGPVPCHTANVRLRGAARKRSLAELQSKSGGSIVKTEESESRGFDTFIVSSHRKRPCLRLEQQPKVPIVVGQLIKANRTLQEEVKRLQQVISLNKTRCTCASDLSYDVHDEFMDNSFVPRTPPEYSECDDVDISCQKWNGMLLSTLSSAPEEPMVRGKRGSSSWSVSPQLSL